MANERFEATLLEHGLPAEQASLPFDATRAPAQRALPECVPGRMHHLRPLPHLSIRLPNGSAARRDGAEADLEVGSLLGEGGMGRVWLARQHSLEREVALKTLQEHCDAHAQALLCAEAVVAGHLEHPGIIPVHALGRGPDGKPVLVMRRVEGVAWRDLIDDASHPAWRGRAQDADGRSRFHIDTLIQVCNAVGFAHSQGIVHRDLKPENVMIGDFGAVYVVDWGLATGAGTKPDPAEGPPTLVGTPAYMAPEMVRCDLVDARTDVYLLGATLHHILTGRPPHTGDNLRAVLWSAFQSHPPSYPESVPAELAALCRRAMAQDPEQRPADALAVRDALLTYVRHRSANQLTASADERMRHIEAGMAATSADRDTPKLYRCLHEARFGYLQALREWPESPAARTGLAHCVESMIDLELDMENVDAARAALADHPSPAPALHARIQERADALLASRNEVARLTAMARDMDPRVGIGMRRTLILIFASVVTAVSAYAMTMIETRALAPVDLVRLACAACLALFALIGLARRKLLTSAFNRRNVGWFATAVVAMVLNRLSGWLTGANVASMFASDLVLFAGMLAVGGILLLRWMWWCVPCFLAGAVLVALFPHAAPNIFMWADFAALAVALLLWQRTY